MDLNKIIRDMLAKGMTEEQVKDNLRELGVTDADAVFAKATERMHEMSAPPASKDAPPSGKKAPEPMKEFSFSQEDEHDLFAEKPAEADAEPEKPVSRPLAEPEDEKPGFSFTSVSDEGEKEVRVGRPALPAVDKAGELMQSVPETSLGDLDAVERKLDQTLAMLKALKDVNEKILQSQRDVLLRLK
ncbi:MAG: hypothetical protein Q8P02_02725 [Candidatus Micrarchaeota archaeon]|nr:hypothetical protein [Candidatus Micrarchaeota archaeon]